MESGCQFCVRTFGTNLASFAIVFSHLIYFVKKPYKFYIFNAICKDDAAVNYITTQRREIIFPSTFTLHMLLLVLKK
jgi:hypothetical protein